VYDASYYEHLRYTDDAARDAYVAHLAEFFEEAVRRWGSPAGSKRLLDVGCATGDFVAWAGRSGWDAEGLDVSAAAVSMGRARGLRLRVGGVDDLAQQGASYDAISLWDVLEHLPDPTGALRAIAAALRPGGLFLLKTVSCRSIVDALAAAAYRATGGLAQGALRRMYVPGHLYYYTPEALARHLAENGWEVILARQADTPPQALFRSRALRAAFTVVAAVQAWTGRCYELFAACRKAGQSG
jgi:2-polyprenyl-3-methyl-5-hydroxy-6-metoxy-1,4-benzoquinol methylase